MACHGGGFGVATVAQQQAGPAELIGGDQAENAFPFMGFSGFIPRH